MYFLVKNKEKLKVSSLTVISSLLSGTYLSSLHRRFRRNPHIQQDWASDHEARHCCAGIPYFHRFME